MFGRRFEIGATLFKDQTHFQKYAGIAGYMCVPLGTPYPSLAVYAREVDGRLRPAAGRDSEAFPRWLRVPRQGCRTPWSCRQCLEAAGARRPRVAGLSGETSGPPESHLEVLGGVDGTAQHKVGPGRYVKLNIVG